MVEGVVETIRNELGDVVLRAYECGVADVDRGDPADATEHFCEALRLVDEAGDEKLRVCAGYGELLLAYGKAMLEVLRLSAERTGDVFGPAIPKVVPTMVREDEGGVINRQEKEGDADDGNTERDETGDDGRNGDEEEGEYAEGKDVGDMKKSDNKDKVDAGSVDQNVEKSLRTADTVAEKIKVDGYVLEARPSSPSGEEDGSKSRGDIQQSSGDPRGRLCQDSEDFRSRVGSDPASRSSQCVGDQTEPLPDNPELDRSAAIDQKAMPNVESIAKQGKQESYVDPTSGEQRSTEHEDQTAVDYYEDTWNILEAARVIFEKLGDKSLPRLAEVHEVIGNFGTENDQFEMAADEFLQATRIHEKLTGPNTRIIAGLHHSRYIAYRPISPEKAKEALREAIRVMECILEDKESQDSQELREVITELIEELQSCDESHALGFHATNEPASAQFGMASQPQGANVQVIQPRKRLRPEEVNFPQFPSPVQDPSKKTKAE